MGWSRLVYSRAVGGGFCRKWMERMLGGKLLLDRLVQSGWLGVYGIHCTGLTPHNDLHMALGRLDSIVPSIWWCWMVVLCRLWMVVTCSVRFAFHGCKGLKVQTLAQIHDQCVLWQNNKSRWSEQRTSFMPRGMQRNSNLKDQASYHVPSIQRSFTISRMIFHLSMFLGMRSLPDAHAFRMSELWGRHLVDVDAAIGPGFLHQILPYLHITLAMISGLKKQNMVSLWTVWIYWNLNCVLFCFLGFLLVISEGLIMLKPLPDELYLLEGFQVSHVANLKHKRHQAMPSYAKLETKFMKVFFEDLWSEVPKECSKFDP